MNCVLLDTCAAIWIANGDEIAASAREAILDAQAQGVPVLISPMTAWEVGLLVSKGRIVLSRPPELWFAALLAQPGVLVADLSPAILIASSFLPGVPPNDPVDRIMAATARAGAHRLVTRDRTLLSYAAEGHLRAIAC